MTKVQLFFAKLAIFFVWISAGWNSYWHTVHVSLHNGMDVVSAYMLPASVDGLMMVASFLVSNAKSLRAKVICYTTLGLGFGISLSCNIMATSSGTKVGMLLSGWYAVSLLLGAELLQHVNKRSMKARQTDKEAALEAEQAAQALAAAQAANAATALKAKRHAAAVKGVKTKAAKKAAAQAAAVAAPIDEVNEDAPISPAPVGNPVGQLWIARTMDDIDRLALIQR